MKKYIITGFSGFVGFHFISYLNSIATEKIEVLGLDITEPIDFTAWNFRNLSISFKKIDLLDKNSLLQAIAEFVPTHILHLAAFSSVGMSWNDPSGCFTNNTGIFLNIAEAVRKQNPECKLVCIGSSEEYGHVDLKNIPIKETLDINPTNPYAVTKVFQENMSRCYVAKYDMNIVLTRSFNHIGTRQRDTFVIPSFVKQISRAYLEHKKCLVMITGNLNVVRDFLDVRDVVAAYYLLLEKGKPGELYNVCSGKGYALKDIISLLSDISGIKIETKTNPELIRPNDIPVIIGCNDKIKADTEWKPARTMQQTLKDIFDYWIEQLSI